MIGKSLYDVLGVGLNATPENIRTAYQQLSANVPANSTSPDEKLRAMAIAHAFITLTDPAKRAQYDKALTVRSQPTPYNIEVIEPFWTLPKLVALAIAIALGGAQYYKYKKEETRLEAERAVTTARAKEAHEKARAQADQPRFDLARRQEGERIAERTPHESDAALKQFNADQRMN